MKTVLTLGLLICFCSTHAQNDTIKTSTSEVVIFSNPEIQAEYPGGISPWFHYLVKNLKYPQDAIDRHIEGKVITRFIVDSAGGSHHFVSIRGPEELRDEAMRLVKNARIWVPATNGGKNVNSWKEQVIGFKLGHP